MVFLCQCVLAERLFDEHPELVEVVVVVHVFRRYLAALGLHAFVVGEELFKDIGVEPARLFVAERGLCQNGAVSFRDDGLDFSVGHGQAQLFRLMFDELVVDVSVPHLVAQLGELLIVERAVSRGELHDFRVFVYQVLEFMYGDVFPVDFADLLPAFVGCRLDRAHGFLGDECKKGQADDDDQQWTLVSDFL